MQKLRIILRSILRQRLNTIVIVISLAIGLACSSILGIFIQNELNIDDFHVYKDRIFALSTDDPWDIGQQMFYTRYGSAEYMKKNFSQVEDFCRYKNASPKKIKINNVIYYDSQKAIAASSNFFEFFSYELLTKNPETILDNYESIVVSEEFAKKYFGTLSASGQLVELGDKEGMKPYYISGVFRKPFTRSQLDFDLVKLIAEEDSPAYLRLNKSTSKSNVEALIKQNTEYLPLLHRGDSATYYLNPLKDVYYRAPQRSTVEPRRDKAELWVAGIIGILVLLIALVNYLGLVNNKLNYKQKEFAIKRFNGSSSFGLVSDFMAESLILIFCSLLLSFALIVLIAPFFNNLVSAKINLLNLFQLESALIVVSLLMVTIFSTLLFVLFRISRIYNSSILNYITLKKVNKLNLPVFTIFQLAASIALIVTSITILKQMNFISNKSIGIDKSVIQVKIPIEYKAKTGLFKEELLRYSYVKNVSKTSSSPVLQHWVLMLECMHNGEELVYTPAGFEGDEDFIETLGIEIIEGRGFSKNGDANLNKVIINQSLAKFFEGTNLLGKSMPGHEENEVIGIAKDFHYYSLKKMVEPAYIGYRESGDYLLVKPHKSKLNETEQVISKIWHEIIPGYPVEIETIAERYTWLHRENQKYIKLIASCCTISVFLSMIGLFAISVQTSKQRIKEIGIRKVNGAKAVELLQLLNQDFIKWVFLALLIACPVSFYLMSQWLSNFAFRTELSWWIFAIAGGLTIFIALATISWQTWQVARRNPIESLRYE